MLIIWTLLFGVVACFLGFALFNSGKNYWQFNVNGLETNATVVSCEIIRQGIRSYRPQVSYVYTVEDAVYNANYDVHSAVSCEQFGTDALIDVKYYMHNPSQSRVVLPHTEGSRLWVIVGTSGIVCGFFLTLAAAILGTVASIYHIRTMRRYLFRSEN